MLKNNIFWATYDNSLKLTTKNLVKGFKFKNEKLIYQDQNELRLWKPYRSKLAAGIINGLEKFFSKFNKLLILAPRQE